MYKMNSRGGGGQVTPECGEVWNSTILSSLMCCPAGKYQCLELDACKDEEPVKRLEERGEVCELRLVEHQTGQQCSVLIAL